MPTLTRITFAASLVLAFAAGFWLAHAWTPASGLRAKYFTNQTRSGPPIVETIDGDVSTDTLGNGTAASWSAFSVEWAGFIVIDRPGRYRFATTSDDGSELDVNDVVVVRNGGNHGAQEATGQTELLAGIYPFRVRYHQAGGAYLLRISWAEGDEAFVPIPSTHLLPDAIGYNAYRVRRYLPVAGGVAAVFVWIFAVPRVYRRLSSLLTARRIPARAGWTRALERTSGLALIASRAAVAMMS